MRTVVDAAGPAVERLHRGRRVVLGALTAIATPDLTRTPGRSLPTHLEQPVAPGATRVADTPTGVPSPVDDGRVKLARQSGLATESDDASRTGRIGRAEQRLAIRGGCTGWYQSRSGHVIAMSPGFTSTFRAKARRFSPEHHVIG